MFGISRLNTLSKAAAVPSRTAKTVTALANAKLSTAQVKFGVSSGFFDGTGDYLAVSPSADFARGTADWTIEFWIRPSNTAACLIFDTRPAGSSSANGISLYYTGSALTYYSGGGVQITGSSLSTNTWHHVALTRSGNDHKLFINGTQSGLTWTSAHSITAVNTSAISIAANSDGPGTLNFTGYIDEIRFSSIARYTANFTPSTSQFTNDVNTLLLVHANGSNNSTVFIDDTQVREQVVLNAFGNAKISTAQSKFGVSSALLDGAGDFITAVGPPTDLLPWYSSDFTVEFWIRPVAMTSFQVAPGGATIIPVLFGNMNATGSGNYWSFGPMNDGSVRFFYYNGTENTVSTTGVTLVINTWFHLAFTHSAGTIKIYVDGTQRATASVSGSPQSGSAIPFTIGQYNNVCASAYIDEIRMSNSVRYTTTFTPSTSQFTNDANTLLLLHMEGTNNATTFTDSTT